MIPVERVLRGEFFFLFYLFFILIDILPICGLIYITKNGCPQETSSETASLSSRNTRELWLFEFVVEFMSKYF